MEVQSLSTSMWVSRVFVGEQWTTIKTVELAIFLIISTVLAGVAGFARNGIAIVRRRRNRVSNE